MKFQASTAQARKKKTGVQASKASMKRLASRSQDTVGIRENIKLEAEAPSQGRKKTKRPTTGAKSSQSQTHRRTKGTLQSPAQSLRRQQKNVAAGASRHG